MDAMGIWSPVWTKPVYSEAMKFWFYSILISIVLRVIKLCEPYRSSPIAISKPPSAVEVSEDERLLEKKRIESQALERKEMRNKGVTELVVDLCNLFNPGTSTGWLPVPSAVQGTLMVVSTVLASTDIWIRVQSR